MPNFVSSLGLTVPSSLQAMDSILYPSITVCYKSSLEIDLFDKMMKSTEPDHDISEFVQETLKNHLWELEDEIHFFTHPGVMNLTFPCTTTLGTSLLRRWTSSYSLKCQAPQRNYNDRFCRSYALYCLLAPTGAQGMLMSVHLCVLCCT